MFVKSSADGASFGRLTTAFRHLPRTLAVVMLAGLSPACVGAPPRPLFGQDPSDPSAQAPHAGYRSTIGSYVRQRPVEPGPWREQNERVAPERRP
jgi:hypothetical protein